MTTKLRQWFWMILLVFLAACSRQVAARPNTSDAQNTAVVIVQTSIALTQTSLPTSTVVYPTPSPLPPQLTASVTLDPIQAEQQEEVKGVLQAYFDLRYQALSVSPPEDFQVDGFGDLVSTGPDAKNFLVMEMAKLATQTKWYELKGYRYAKYEYSLKYKDIFFDNSARIATISLLEDFTIVTKWDVEFNPEEPSTIKGDLTHEIVLHSEQGQWKIISDTYWDAWWLRYRRPGMSTDEILNEINTGTRTMKAVPNSVLASASIDTEFSCNFNADVSNHSYDRIAAADYAKNHGSDGSYNPNYPNYNGKILGGDCTNFVSQSIYEGGNASMAIPPTLPQPGIETVGWYLLNDMQRATAWNDVGKFHEFVLDLTAEWSEGPEGCVMTYETSEELAERLGQIMPGDVIQYDWDGDGYWDHSAIVVGRENGIVQVASHSPNFAKDKYDFSPYDNIRLIHIERSDGYPPVKTEITLPADDAGGNPANPCPYTNWDNYNNYLGGCLNGGNVTSGFLFRGIPIPPGAQIKYAYVTFTTDGTYGVAPGAPGQVYAPISLQISAENSANPLDFLPTNTPAHRTNNLTSPIPWAIDGSVNGALYDTWAWRGKRTTPDLTNAINPIFSLDDWQIGNDLSLIFLNNGSGTHVRRVIAKDAMTETYYKLTLRSFSVNLTDEKRQTP